MKALDLFAGTGWGVACQRLGIDEAGVEIMPAAVQTRTLHGMETIFGDVWAGLEDPSLCPEYDLLIGSPPCQTFSTAGKGKGVEALATVLSAIDEGAFKDVALLRELVEATDPKTALVLTPLAYVWRDRPRLVVLEQVPQVAPVWHAMAAVMRQVGYSVVVEILDAECYGVPQTRDRAILIGRLDGIAEMPAPSHSRYYSADPDRMDPDVEPWISMADALGWGGTTRPAYTLTGGGVEGGGYEPFPTGARAGMQALKERGEWVVRTSMGTPAVDGRNGTHELDPFARPAHTVTSKSDSWVRVITNQDSDLGHGKKRRYSRLTSAPSPTLTSNARLFKKSTNTDIEDPSGVKLTVEEASLLQSYPPGFEWCGSDTKKFLQIGNAVPVLLAEAVLAAVLTPARERTVWEEMFAEVAG